MIEERIKPRSFSHRERSRYCRGGKRVLDVCVAYLLLAVCYLPMIIISVCIRLSTGDSSIFRQIRVGVRGECFVCYKFRTMRSDAPVDMSKAEFLNAEDYITPIGAFLRRTSLDELPQLFNVINGDMSIVGPRPLIPKEQNMHDMRAHSGVYTLRPGITGLAQVMGRDELCDLEKLEYDVQYLSCAGFLTDVKIIFKTLCKVCSCEGMKECRRSSGKTDA